MATYPGVRSVQALRMASSWRLVVARRGGANRDAVTASPATSGESCSPILGKWHARNDLEPRPPPNPSKSFSGALPERGGQVHVFGQRVKAIANRVGRKMDQTPDFAVLPSLSPASLHLRAGTATMGSGNFRAAAFDFARFPLKHST